MTIKQDLKAIFGKITPIQTAANELADAELALLRAESGVEYATSLVTYNRARIKRLKTYLATQNRQGKQNEH